MSHVTCHMSHVTCHLSPMPTATATDPPPANSPTMHYVGWCAQNKKTEKKFKTTKIIETANYSGSIFKQIKGNKINKKKQKNS